MANVGKSIILVGGFRIGDMDKVEQVPHCQRDTQRMRKRNGAGVREIGWMNDRLNPARHDILEVDEIGWCGGPRMKQINRMPFQKDNVGGCNLQR
jgi:hypothetical protein